MALSTSGKNKAADGVTAVVAYLSLHTADPGGTGASEVTGGSPAYARKAVTWNAASGGAGHIASSVTFDVPGSTTVAYFGMWSASTSGTYYGGGALSASETFGAQGTYTLTDADVAIS